RRPPRISSRDRQTLLHASQSLAPAGDGPVPAQASRTTLRTPMSAGKYDRQAERWSETAYADTATYLAHRGRLVLSVGPPLERGAAVLDLACGDGGLADHLPAVRYLGVDASPEMVSAAN